MECNSEANSPNWPEIELVQDGMPVLVTCKFVKDPIKTEVAVVSTTFLQRSRQVTLKSIYRNGQNSNLFEILCLSWFPASLMEIRLKMKALSIVSTTFSPL